MMYKWKTIVLPVVIQCSWTCPSKPHISFHFNSYFFYPSPSSSVPSLRRKNRDRRQHDTSHCFNQPQIHTWISAVSLPMRSAYYTTELARPQLDCNVHIEHPSSVDSCVPRWNHFVHRKESLIHWLNERHADSPWTSCHDTHRWSVSRRPWI